MIRAKFATMFLLVTLTVGSLATTGGYAWYLRSAAFRTTCTEYLAKRLSLPCEIGRVVPLSRRSREFRNVVVWLPERRGRALTCRQAFLRHIDDAARPKAYTLDLIGGECELSSRTWLNSDYRVVMESGLRPGFSPNGPRRVNLAQMNVEVVRGGFRARLNDAAGHVSFDSPAEGSAAIMCRALNGQITSEPVFLTTHFSPQRDGIRIDRLELRVPTLPLAAAGLRDVIGIDLEHGLFAGNLTYEERDDGNRLVIQGRCSDLDLREWTAGLPAQPWRGRCPRIELQDLRLEDGIPERLAFRGEVTELDIGDVLATWGISGAQGKLELRVGAAELSRNGIDRFVASGSGKGIELEALAEALGLPPISGRLRIRIDDVTIVENRVESLRAKIEVERRPDEAPNWISGRFLREMISRALQFTPPPFLPDRIKYQELGVRLEIDNETLLVFGTHGDHERTILTVRMLGEDVPLVFEPNRSFDLRPWLDLVRKRLFDEIRRNWPTSRPIEQLFDTLGDEVRP